MLRQGWSWTGGSSKLVEIKVWQRDYRKMRRYWLVKSEPFKYSWDDLVRDKEEVWDGVRNHRAKNNLQAMKVGEDAFYYHSREGLEIVGICTVSVADILDPTDSTGKWAAVKFKPKKKFANPVSLKAIKAEPRLADCELVRLGRLSVAEMTAEEWQVICEMAGVDPD